MNENEKMISNQDTFDIHCSSCEQLVLSGIHKGNMPAYEKIELKCSNCGFNGVGIHSGIVNVFNNLRIPNGLTLTIPKMYFSENKNY